MNAGLLILQLFVGLAMGAHGAQKLFGWWGGPGVRGFGKHMAHMRFRPASVWIAGAIGTEIGGGLLLALGLLSPLGSVGVGASMLVAIVAVHWGKGFFGHGSEVPLLYLVPAAVVGITGPGSYSLELVVGDHVARTDLGNCRRRPGHGRSSGGHGWARSGCPAAVRRACRLGLRG